MNDIYRVIGKFKENEKKMEESPTDYEALVGHNEKLIEMVKMLAERMDSGLYWNSRMFRKKKGTK